MLGPDAAFYAGYWGASAPASGFVPPGGSSCALGFLLASSSLSLLQQVVTSLWEVFGILQVLIDYHSLLSLSPLERDSTGSLLHIKTDVVIPFGTLHISPLTFFSPFFSLR